MAEHGITHDLPGKIDPKHSSGPFSTKNRKSKVTSGPSKGRGKEVGPRCGHK